MRSSRGRGGRGRGLLVGIALALAALSAHSVPARSEGSGSGSETPTRAEPDDDDSAEGSGGSAGSGSGAGRASGPSLPPDPKARAAWLRDRIAAAQTAHPGAAKAKLAYAAIDLATGEELVAHAADQGMTLASNAKLLTTTAALRQLGSGFRWRTAVFAAAPDEQGAVAGDLYLRGRGDPTLSVAALHKLAEDVAARGVRSVERLVIDATYFDDAVEPPHFDEQPRERAAFRAPVASLGVGRSAVTVTVIAEPGGGARVTLQPESDYVRLGKLEVTSAATGRTRLRVDPRARGDAIELDVTGQIRAGEGSWELRRRIDDPARLAGEVFRRALAAQGVRVRSRALGNGAVPPTLRPIAVHDSAPLSDVLRLVNKHSDNYIAESILKTLGAEARAKATPAPAAPAPATWADGVAAMREQLAALGVTGRYRSDNGSGLFASSEVTARQLLALLAAAHRDYRIGPDLVASLPTGGLDGTLARRWVGKPAMGRVRAKTGTLDKVSTLAGYIGVDGGHLVAFAILVNDIPPGQWGAVRATVDEMVEALASYLGAT